MEAGFIRFDPESEFKVIESIDFEEEVARPEALRFFTLDEQLTDYFDKVLPKKGKITKFEYRKIATEVDRVREIYEDIITVTDAAYSVDLSRKDVDVNWVYPIYTEISLNPYSYKENWLPLYNSNLRSTANYYQRILSALPKPYKTTGTQGVSFTNGGRLVDEEGKNTIYTLPVYERTKQIIHEDGSISIVKLPMANTADDVKVKGFYIEKRSLDIPNPLAGHPFLSSNEPSKFLTDEPLSRVFPTIEAIITHGVPKTNDPYTEGKKFLKIYDVKLSQIPWNLWKEQFSPVDTISATPEILSVKFPDSEESEPSKNIKEVYEKFDKWYPGIEPRFWLGKQEDNGNLVFKMILSNASKSGLLAPAILGEKPISALTASSPDDCFVTDTFDGFLNTGLYRSPKWSDINSAIDKHKALPVGHCIPVAQIVQEKADFLVGNKIAWKETEDVNILKEHQQLLKYFHFLETKPKVVVYEKYAGHAESETRRQIVAVLKDITRDPVDKADAIEKILRGSTLKERVYFDATESFLLCGHTLADLRGEMENDLQLFYDTWTTIDEGFRSCTSCGQRINGDVYSSQDDFDEDGNVIISHDVLQTSAFHGEGHVASFTNSINSLKPIFKLENAGESILYLLISLMQVLPTEAQLIPIVQNIRTLTDGLRGRNVKKEDKERVECILGIAGMVTLLQIHNPFLIPRRSFGSKILKLTGFPRDTDDEKDAPTLDTLISILKTTFESSPNTFTGPIKTIIRLVISKPKDIRKETVLFLKQAHKKFNTEFLAAKEKYVAPDNTIASDQLSLPVLPVEKSSYTPNEKIGKEELKSECSIYMPRSYLSGRLPPNVLQDQIVLAPTKISNFATTVEGVIEKYKRIDFSKTEISNKIKVGFPKSTKLDKIETFLKSDTDGIAFLALLNRILDIISKEGFDLKTVTEYRYLSVYLETTIQKSLLRDAVRGVVYELLHEVVKNKNKAGLLGALNTAVQRDLVFSMILITKEQATKQDSDLRTREREVFKQRMRQMNDTEREATKMLLDIGIAPYIITTQDRELFAKEYRLPDPEVEYDRIMNELDGDRPEEGYNAFRDTEDDVAAIVNGHEQEVDYGDYGDRRERNREYENLTQDNDGEGYGV